MRRIGPLPWPAWVLLLGGIAFGVERLIVTDAEALGIWADDAAAAATAGNVPALTALCHVDLTYEGRDRAATIQYAIGLRRRAAVGSIDVDLRDLAIEGDEATAQARIRVTAMGRPLFLDSRLAFLRTPDGWRLRAASPVSWDVSPLR